MPAHFGSLPIHLGRRTALRGLTCALAALLCAGTAAAAEMTAAAAAPNPIGAASLPPAGAAATTPSPGTPGGSTATELPRHPATKAGARRSAGRTKARKTKRRDRAGGLTMEQAIARIPGYRPGAARWVVSNAYGSWGTADWYEGVIYISPRVPRHRMYDVVVHEWSHLASVAPYGGNVSEATAAMNAWFGGGGLTGAERAADCMARMQGARWTHYTDCGNGHWQEGARRLLAGQRL